MQWRAGARRQVHETCGRVVKLSRRFRPPPVDDEFAQKKAEILRRM